MVASVFIVTLDASHGVVTSWKKRKTSRSYRAGGFDSTKEGRGSGLRRGVNHIIGELQLASRMRPDYCCWCTERKRYDGSPLGFQYDYQSAWSTRVRKKQVWLVHRVHLHYTWHCRRAPPQHGACGSVFTQLPIAVRYFPRRTCKPSNRHAPINNCALLNV